MKRPVTIALLAAALLFAHAQPVRSAPQFTFVRNAGFESGSNGLWAEYSSLGADFLPLIQSSAFLPVYPHAGLWVAWLGGTEGETATLSQRVYNDQNYLVFYYQIHSADYSCYRDTARVRLDGITRMTFQLCDANDFGNWGRAVVPVGDLKNQNVEIEFRVTNSATDISSFFIDDVGFANTTGHSNFVFLPILRR
jgi:hypothetical protein